MYSENCDDNVKIALLGQKIETFRSELEDLDSSLIKVVESIERTTALNANIEKMLAVYNERMNSQDEKINSQEQFDRYIHLRLDRVSDRVETLNRRQIFGLGILVAFIFAINNVSFFKSLLTKPEPPARIESHQIKR